MVYVVGKGVPVVAAADGVGVACRAFVCAQQAVSAESDRHGDVAPRHGERVAAVGVTADWQIAAPRILDGDALYRRAIRFPQRDGLPLARTRGSGLKGAVAIVAHVHRVRILHGIAVQVIAREAVQVVPQYSVVAQVIVAVLVSQVAVLVTHVLIVLTVYA